MFLLAASNKSFSLLLFGLVVSLSSTPTKRQTQFSGSKTVTRDLDLEGCVQFPAGREEGLYYYLITVQISLNSGFSFMLNRAEELLSLISLIYPVSQAASFAGGSG